MVATIAAFWYQSSKVKGSQTKTSLLNFTQEVTKSDAKSLETGFCWKYPLETFCLKSRFDHLFFYCLTEWIRKLVKKNPKQDSEYEQI